MAPSWTPDKLQKFLQLLNEQHKDLFTVFYHSNMQKKMRKDTIDKIAKELKMPAQAVKYKYFNLNSAYNMELKKIDSAKAQGFFYRPTLSWFNEFRDVMEKVKNSNKLTPGSEEPKGVSPQEDSISEEEIELEEGLEDDEQETSNADTIVVTIKQEYIDGPLKGSRDVDFDEDPVNFVQETQAIQPHQQQSARKAIKRRHEKQQEVECVKKVTNPINDEFQMFANHVAEQLRTLNTTSARKMQSEIHIIFDEEGFPFDSPVLEDMT